MTIKISALPESTIPPAATDVFATVENMGGAKVTKRKPWSVINAFVGARAYLSATLGTTVSGATTKVLLDAESYDVGGNFAAYKFVAPVNGYYQIVGQVFFTGCAADKAFYAIVNKNNAALAQSHSQTSAAGATAVPATDIVYLAATDYIELFYNHNDATTVDLFAGFTYLTVVLLKAA